MKRDELPLGFGLDQSTLWAWVQRAATPIAIVLGYAVIFFAVLPFALWRIGTRFDGWFGLARPGDFIGFVPGSVLAASGTLLTANAMWSLWRKGRGLPISHLPPRFLVSTGPFAALRHPIYVGYTLAFAGAGLISGSLGRGVLAPAILTLAWVAYAAGLEEPALRRRFGAEYDRYAAQTSRLPLPYARRVSALASRAWRGLRPLVEMAAERTVLFTIGPTVWVTFGALLSLGAVLSAAAGMALFAKILPARAMDEYIVGVVLSMQLGARLGWLGYQGRAVWHAPWRTLRRVGFVSFGSYVTMFAFSLAWWILRAPAIDVGSLADRTMMACSISACLGRVGCLTYGCCYGRVSEHGVCWRDPRAKVVRERGAAGHLPRVPTQLLSAAWALVVCALGFALMALAVPPGVPAALSTLVYALGRFAIESLRDEERWIGGRLTRGQLLSAALAGVALIIVLFLRPSGPALPFTLSLGEPLHHGPALFIVALMVFLVGGYHRRTVGQW